MVRTENEQDFIKVNGNLANFLFSFLEILRSALGHNWGGFFNSERKKEAYSKWILFMLEKIFAILHTHFK